MRAGWIRNLSDWIGKFALCGSTEIINHPKATLERLHKLIIEGHFREKKEVSGTAKIIARTLDLPEEEIKSVRAGGIIGVHEILFGFPYQTVRLRHESITREAFGNGILFAVDNLQGRPAGFYSMEDLLLPYFSLSDSPSGLTEG